jgi:hypothetical protein
MWELGAGGLLVLLPAQLSQNLARRGWLGWAGLALVVASPIALRGTTAFPGALALLPVTGAVLLIAGGSARGRYGPARLMSARPLVFLGGISYSLYLWHWPVIDLWSAWQGKQPGPLSGPALVAVSLLLAWLTKVLVEDRVRLSPLLTGHGWRSVSTALAVVVPVAMVSVYIAGGPGQWNGKLGPGYPGAAALAHSVPGITPEPVLPPLSDLHAAVPEYWQQGCLDDVRTSEPKECVYGDTANPRLKVALVGDSVAGNWFPAIDEIALQQHWELITDLHGDCAWTATMMIDQSTGDANTACYEWGAAVLHDLLTTIQPDVVLTSDLPGTGSVAYPQPGPRANADIGSGMARYWTQLEDHGISVVPIQETPVMGFNIPDCVAEHGASSQDCEVPAAKDHTRPAHPRRRARHEQRSHGDRHEPVHLRPGRMSSGRRKCPGLLRRPPLDQHVLQNADALPQAATAFSVENKRHRRRIRAAANRGRTRRSARCYRAIRRSR